MHTKLNAKTFKNTFVSAIAISLMAFPLLSSASDKNSDFFSSQQLRSHSAEEKIVYSRLQDASREICGSSSLRATGSVERVVANEECYEGTLTAAVERLNDSKVKQLHEENS